MLEGPLDGCIEYRRDLFRRLEAIDKKGDLGKALALEALKYSIYDLQYISSGLAYEINKLPSPYREKIAPYFIEQFFRRYYRLIDLYNDGAFARPGSVIKENVVFHDYCRAVEGNMAEYADAMESDPQHGLFYFIVNCFAMFVVDEPGHPVGMPFPGGFKVRQKDGIYYCPIREKEKDIPHSICNFCPCKQDDV